MMVGSNNMPNGSIDMANTMLPNGRPVKPLPPGNYQVVGIDIDTTGRRLIDEIVQLAAFTPNDHFEQYIMPYMNLNPAARQRHQVRVISIGFYRMLKSMHTYKIIKSKTEIAALKDFLDWLEAMKAKDPKSNGIILVYHEERKFIPYMILESLKKYNLLDRFLLTVKSFVNSLNLAKNNVNEQWQHYSLRKLSKVLSSKASSDANNNSGGNGNGSEANGTDQQQQNSDNASGQPQFNQSRAQNRQQQHSQGRDVFDGSASVRAKLTYEVTLQLANQESQDPIDSPNAIKRMLNALQPFAQPVDCDLNELQTQNENLERQNSFRPVFLNYFKTTIYHRVRAVKFRIILAEQGYDLQTMNAIWNERQKEGLIEILQPIEDLKTDDKNELADLFDSYFDPSKVTIKPVVRNNNSRRRNRRGMRMNSKYDGNNNRRSNEQGAGGDKQIPSGGGNNMPDSTTKSPVPMANGMKPQRGRRNPRSRNNSKSKPNSLNSGNNNNANQMSNATAPQTTAVA